MRRLHYLDFLRGLAALLVVCQHATEALHLDGFQRFSSNWLNIGQVGVLIFFLISGYIIPYSYEGASRDLRAFWISRVFRIYPLYFAIIPLSMLNDMALHHIHVSHLALSLAAHLIFVQSWVGLYNFGGPSWTLFLELLWYGAFSLICVSSLNVRIKLLMSVVIFGYLFCVLASFFVHRHLPMGRLAYGLSFFIGYICYQYRNACSINGDVFYTYLVSMLLLIVGSLYSGFDLRPESVIGDHFSFRDVLLNWSVGLAIFFVLFAKHELRFSKYILNVGKISYSTYMSHPLIISLLSLAALKNFVFLALVIIGTLCVSSITYYFIEKPFIQVGRRLKLSLTLQTEARPA